MVTQLTGLTGQLGAIAAAGPLSYLLHELGWTRAFALTSSVGVVLLVAVLALVKDSPYRSDGVVVIKLRALAQSVRTVWGNPGTRLGMWSHFSSQFSVTVFALLWGYPFLVQGLGWSSRGGQHPADGDDGLGGGERAGARAAGGRGCPTTARGSWSASSSPWSCRGPRSCCGPASRRRGWWS